MEITNMEITNQEKENKKNRAHTIYKLEDGTKVPGTTTIVGLRAKPQLISWANRLGLQGIDSTKYVEQKATIGTLAHYLILCHLKKVEPDVSDYSSRDISSAENSFISYLNWEKQNKLIVLLTETSMCSERYKFGGTFDLLCKLNQKITLLDFKTGSGIYPEHFYQLAGYQLLVTEHNFNPVNFIVLKIGRDENETFEMKQKKDLTIETKIFLDLLDIYYQEKLLKTGG